MHEKSILSSHRTLQNSQAKIYKEDTETPKDLYYIEKVLDWEKRIASYPNPIKAKYRNALKKRDLFFARLAEPQSNDWKVFIDNKKKGLFAEVKTSENGMPMFRARTHSNHDALTTFRFSGSCENRPKYDKNTDYAKVI